MLHGRRKKVVVVTGHHLVHDGLDLVLGPPCFAGCLLAGPDDGKCVTVCADQLDGGLCGFGVCGHASIMTSHAIYVNPSDLQCCLDLYVS